jgi:selenoprotein W-related protein
MRGATAQSRIVKIKKNEHAFETLLRMERIVGLRPLVCPIRQQPQCRRVRLSPAFLSAPTEARGLDTSVKQGVTQCLRRSDLCQAPQSNWCALQDIGHARTDHPSLGAVGALPATVRFLVPSLSQSGGGGVEGNRVCIEYCTGCRWGLRASWMASELLVTFNDRSIGEVAIRPSNEPGTFDVWVVRNADGLERRVWCRKEEGGFPELKELKQRIRDIVAPQQDLGHSDCRSEEPSAS